MLSSTVQPHSAVGGGGGEGMPLLNLGAISLLLQDFTFCFHSSRESFQTNFLVPLCQVMQPRPLKKFIKPKICF